MRTFISSDDLYSRHYVACFGLRAGTEPPGMFCLNRSILPLSDAEGTIQFAYDLQPAEIPALSAEAFAELYAWRSILFTLDLIGQHPDRYGGYAYGNLSSATDTGFAITASQTSGTPELIAEHIVNIIDTNLRRFWVDARGAEPPSSESLTHAIIYQADAKMRHVFHIHSAEIWGMREVLRLPETPDTVTYGSTEMVLAVNELLAKYPSRPLVFATAGHEGGIFALGHHARDCGGLLVTYLAKARALSS